ncbi:MAG: hypothetical protein ACRDY6_15200 [Acidimicrobiia bacterium]
MASTLSDTAHVRYDVTEGERFNMETTLVAVNCATCGVLYAIPESFHRSALKYRGDTANGWKIVCPFGHEWWYVGETEKQKLREQLEAERTRRALAASQRDQARADARAQKAAKTRFKNQRDQERQKAHAGVCPVAGCRRHFKDLRRHMQSKHPELPAE